MHSNRKEFTDLVTRYKNSLGLDVSLTSKGHWKLKNPVTGKQAVLASASGDRHAIHNAVKLLKNQFGDIPETPTKMKNPTITGIIVTTQPPTPEPVVGEAVIAPVSTASPSTESPTNPVPLPTATSQEERYNPKTWIEFFKHATKETGVSVLEIAHLLEVSRTTAHRWATGVLNPDLSRRSAFENLFTVDFSNLPWGQLSVSGRKPRTKDSIKQKVNKSVKTPVKNQSTSMQHVPETWADFFAYTRDVLSLTDHRVAAKVEAGQSSISRWRAGKQRPSLARKHLFVGGFPDVDFSKLGWGSAAHDPLSRQNNKSVLPRVVDDTADLPNRFINPTPMKLVTAKTADKGSDYWAQVAVTSMRVSEMLVKDGIGFEDMAKFVESFERLRSEPL